MENTTTCSAQQGCLHGKQEAHGWWMMSCARIVVWLLWTWPRRNLTPQLHPSSPLLRRAGPGPPAPSHPSPACLRGHRVQPPDLLESEEALGTPAPLAVVYPRARAPEVVPHRCGTPGILAPRIVGLPGSPTGQNHLLTV